MPKLLLYIPGNARSQGFKLYDFLWNVEHACFLYEGRPLELAEFNTKYEYCMKRFRHLLKNISVKVLADPAPAIELDVALSPPREMTAEEAEAVLEKLAPHRLKKKPGPKIDQPAVAA